jgi:hypothetical protein
MPNLVRRVNGNSKRSVGRNGVENDIHVSRGDVHVAGGRSEKSVSLQVCGRALVHTVRRC